MPVSPRLFIEDELPGSGRIALTEKAGHYLTRVLRLQAGDDVRLFNGRDGEWRAQLASADRRAAVEAVEPLRSQTMGPDLLLLFAPLKKARTDYVVEKATELGVAAIQPIITARTQTSRINEDRLRATAVEAAEQTERLDVPKIGSLKPLDAVLADWPSERALIFADESGDDASALWGGEAGRAQPIMAALSRMAPGPAALLVGPEGGFTADERARLRRFDAATPVSLGPRILRAETAVAAALAVWQAALGDWR